MLICKECKTTVKDEIHMAKHIIKKHGISLGQLQNSADEENMKIVEFMKEYWVEKETIQCPNCKRKLTKINTREEHSNKYILEDGYLIMIDNASEYQKTTDYECPKCFYKSDNFEDFGITDEML